MRVLWVSHTANLEGAEKSLIEAVTALHQKGVEVHVVFPEQGELISKLDGIASTHIAPYIWWVYGGKQVFQPFKEPRQSLNLVLRTVKKLTKILRALPKLEKVLKDVQPSLIITNTIVIPCGALAAYKLGIPHIWYIREFLEEDHGCTFIFGRKFSLFLVDKISRKIITNSQATYNRFSGEIPQAKLSVVHNAVEISQEIEESIPPSKQEGTFYISLIGRKTPAKGQKDAIEALAILLKNGVNAHLWLVGGEPGNHAKDLMKRSEELGIADKIDFIPFAKNPSLYMQMSDVVLMCSRCEAFGRVTIEAMKLGKPVIGSNSGSTPDLIKDKWNGLLYDAGCARSLAEKIELISKDKELKNQLEFNAYQWANSKFNLANHSADLINIFSEVVQDKNL